MYVTPDRRAKPRIECDYPAIIEGYNGNGEKYSDQGRLANLSASGLLMNANRSYANGTKLSITVLLSSFKDDADGPRLATSGTVVRTDINSDGTCGVAIKFTNFRFL